MSAPAIEVVYDDQAFTSGRHGGIARYFAELIHHFREDPALGVDAVSLARFSISQPLLERGLARRAPLALMSRWGPSVRPLNRLRGQVHGDISHNTYFEGRYLDRDRGSISVTTVYDMIPELMPELFPAGNPHREKRRYVERADHVICISESTARDLTSVYADLDLQPEVIALGVGAPFAPGLAPAPNVPERYVLYVGDRAHYKDFPTFLRAFSQIEAEIEDSAVIAGGPPLSSAEIDLLDELGIGPRVAHLPADDQLLAHLYGNATCFVFPSLYEGFGLPTLEAMACGAPVILANSSAHPEVGGDAALYFAPGDCEDLARQLLSVCRDPRLAGELGSASLARSKHFSWQKTAERHASTYRRLARGTDDHDDDSTNHEHG